jgi:SAM-dependent methyltransferase
VSTVRQAFDLHASVYDQTFSGLPIRSEIWKIADSCFPSGSRLLDLGCGTGDDAIHFSERGLNVTAVDVSPQMIAELKRKAGDSIHSEVADMRAYVAAMAPGAFQGVFSNFGALNCVSDLDWLGRIRLSPGAHLVLTAMGRFYPLESALFLMKGQPGRAFRRFGRRCEAAVEGVRFDVYYHGLQAMRRALGRNFELKQVRGFCSLVPAPGLEHLQRYVGLRWLEPLDRWLCSRRPTAAWADHFVSVWRCR